MCTRSASFPHRTATEFHGLWESLVLEPGVADTLLDHAESALVFAAAGVDERLVSWNRLVLLHGPPGTGLFVVSVLGWGSAG